MLAEPKLPLAIQRRMIGKLWARFRGAPAAAPDLEAMLRNLEVQAESPALDFRAALYGRAGDLCWTHADPTRALQYWGRAVDAYLGVGYYDAAATLCRKIIDHVPGVVRTRCTLAFLLLGDGLPYLPQPRITGEAADELDRYVAAARASGAEEIAIRRLRMMSEVTGLPDVRRHIADLLFGLGDTDAAAELFYEQFEEQAQLVEASPNRAQEQRERWAEVLRVTIMGE